MMNIPEDVLVVASRVAESWAEPLYDDSVSDSEAQEVVDAIADVILSERKRCAEVARRTYAKDAFHFELGTAIAEAIMAGA